MSTIIKKAKGDKWSYSVLKSLQCLENNTTSNLYKTNKMSPMHAVKQLSKECYSYPTIGKQVKDDILTIKKILNQKEDKGEKMNIVLVGQIQSK